MTPRYTRWIVVVGVVCSCIAVLACQHVINRRLEGKLERKQQQIREIDRLRSENATLSAEIRQRVAARGDTEARVRRENKELMAAQAELASASNVDAGGASAFTTNGIIPADRWKIAGNESPPAALESVLYAAAGGDLNELVDRLTAWDPRVLDRARILFASLPPAERGRYRTPQRLIVALAITSLPLSAISVQGWSGPDIAPEPTASVRALLYGPTGTVKSVTLSFRHTVDGWKVLIPERAVARLAAQLAAPAR